MAALSSQHGGGSVRHEPRESEDYQHNYSYPQKYSNQSPQQSPHTDEYPATQNSTFPAMDGQARGYENNAGQAQFGSGVLTERPINSLGSQYPEFDNESSKRADSSADLQPPKKRQARSGQSAGSFRGPSSSNRVWSKKSVQEIDRENSSNWVHREKLIALEIQDHKERGEPVPQALVDAYRESTGNYHVSLEDIQHELTENNLQRHTLTSPIPGDGDERGQHGEDFENDEPFVPEDPRSPEEIAADEEYAADKMYHSPALRSSSSRIPVSKRSPYPVPMEHIERNTPLPRKRSASIGWEAGEDGIMYAKTRSRSQSVGSQVLLDDGETPSVPSSPNKTRQSGAKSSPRKSSTHSRGGASISKIRAPSGSQGSTSSPANRPSTHDRPRTAVNRPEEPAPWLADMYKPDPRLPPDQQIIPTHAKRIMQQERTREEAEEYARYNAEERHRAHQQQLNATSAALQKPPPMRSQGAGGSLSSTQHGPIGEITTYENGKMSEPTRSPVLRDEMGRGHGSYSTMPKVVGTPVIGSRMQSPVPEQHLQMQDVEEKEKGGCGCCVVM